MLRMRSPPFAFTFVIRFVAQVDKGAIESPQEKLPLQMKGQQYEDYLLQHHCYSGDSPGDCHGEPRKLTQKLTARWQAAREVSSCQTYWPNGGHLCRKKVHAK
jgi:hypothetical protein